MPPALARALEPKVERTISLELAEVVRQMPQGLVRPLENEDASRRVLLKASELERGMASGRPTVSVYTIFQQVPGIFIRQIEPSDEMQAPLPFQKVLEQISNLQVRTDQAAVHAVPQFETPFLKVTQEDGERFGVSPEPVPMPVHPSAETESPNGDKPSVRMEPATAKTLSDAEPETSYREKSIPHPAPPEPVTPPAETKPSTTPARIPFQLSPKGADAPAHERVPASSGASVPTSAAPARIPFKLAVPGNGTPPAADPWMTKENPGGAPSFPMAKAPAAASANGQHGPLIALALRPILQGLSPLQLIGDAANVSADASLQVPFSLVEPQLASGRVLIEPDKFAELLPAEFRALFDSKQSSVSVVLPLHEVLKNLPAASLRMRDDQLEPEKGLDVETPFSVKADEDAKRFQTAPAPVAKPITAAVAPVAAAPVAEPVAMPAPVISATTPERTGLQNALETDDELDAKKVVALVSKMPGVKACGVMFGDGLSLAGNLPEEHAAEGLCAVAPLLLQRIETNMRETNLGQFHAMTLACSKATFTFLMHDNLCLAVLHAQEELATAIRERLGRVLLELSRQYSHPA